MDRYVIVVNTPGYLPEGEPYEVDNLDEARACAATEVGNERAAVEDFPELERANPDWDSCVAEAYDIPVDGGVVRLPNGRVVDVRRERVPSC